MAMTPRSACVLSLNSCFKNGRFVNLELDSAIKKYGFEGVDKSFFTALLYGTCERIITIDYILSQFSKTPIQKIEPLMLANLRSSVYQIFYMDRVPDSAACNEAVEICKALCPHSFAGFLNAVLRNIVRNKSKLSEQINSLTGLEGISVKYSVPLEIVKLFAKDYSQEGAEKICRAFCNNPPYLSIHVNTLKISAERLRDALGNVADYDAITREGLRIRGTIPPKDLCGFDDGLFFVQDTASIKCSELLMPQDVSDTVQDGKVPFIIDICACPGGKSFAAALNFKNKAEILSMDLHSNRLSLIESSAKRLGITCITTRQNNAKTPLEEYFGKADAVICDVPCSGLGVIAKKADIKYKDVSDIQKLPALQYEILCNSVKYLKKGGTVVYSTCTLVKQENEEIIRRFLSEHEDFSLVPFEIGKFKTAGVATLRPDIHGTDGFFMAKLKKAK